MADTKRFIETVGAVARNEFLNRDRWILPSVCIAQAALESGWNLNARSLFGIKGNGFTATTSEFRNGEYVRVVDSFRSYPSVSSSIVGYYNFITKTPRYSGAVNNSDPYNTVYRLIHTTDGKPYATDPNYINKVMSIINKYNLRSYDDRGHFGAYNVNAIALDVIRGKYGNGNDRRNRLESAGYDYSEVQAEVNRIMKNKR